MYIRILLPIHVYSSGYVNVVLLCSVKTNIPVHESVDPLGKYIRNRPTRMTIQLT